MFSNKKKALYVSGGIFGYLTISFAAYSINRRRLDKKFFIENQNSSVYENFATQYDNRINKTELDYGFDSLRQEAVGNLNGSVLEVSAGTGRNLPFYNNVSELTLTDVSQEMLNQAKEKQLNSNETTKFKTIVADSEQLPFENETFDNVVDTFGLCACQDPIQQLNEMKRVLKSNGKIILLEHGRSNFPPLSWYLDWTTPRHFRVWGCQYNKNIDDIVQKSNLNVLERKTKHWGTTYYFVCMKKTENE